MINLTVVSINAWWLSQGINIDNLPTWASVVLVVILGLVLLSVIWFLFKK